MKFVKALLSNRRPKATAAKPRGPSSRGQAMVETALIFPILLVLFASLIDGGMALNAWLRVNTAARDATRFALDAGSDEDIEALVVDKLDGLLTNPLDIYIIEGRTDNTGIVYGTHPYWVVDYQYGTRGATPNVTAADIQTHLATQSASGANRTMFFIIVEVDLNYAPMFANILRPGLSLPMSSYAIIARSPQ